METSKIITVIFSTFLGAGLGFLAKSYFSRMSFRQSTIESVVKRYLDARDEICELVANCAVKANPKDENWLTDTRNSISIAYYKYFDYMPAEIIKELICLQACLRDKKNRLHKIESENLMLLNKNDIEAFCEKISTLKNVAHAIIYNLYNGDEDEKRKKRIEYQARHTLVNINIFFTEENLTSLALFRPKSHSRALRRAGR